MELDGIVFLSRWLLLEASPAGDGAKQLVMEAAIATSLFGATSQNLQWQLEPLPLPSRFLHEI